MAINLIDCEFPSPGIYIVELYANNEFVDDFRLTLQPLDEVD